MNDAVEKPWAIEPRSGVGPLKLGMSRAEVDAFSDAIGPVKRYFPDPSGSQPLHHLERRTGGGPLCIYLDEVLVEIMLTEFTTLDTCFGGSSVFKENSARAYETFVEADPQAVWDGERIVLPRLSIQLTGFVMEFDPGAPPRFAEDVDWHQAREVLICRPGVLDKRAARGRPVWGGR